MVKQTYDKAITEVFEWEGGYTNDAADPGGPTNWGITIFDARMYWKPDATAADVRAMPKSVASEIYVKHYADPVKYDLLPAGVDYAVLDYGINSGISRAAKVLQRISGAPVDGKIGLATVAAARAMDPADLVRRICDERLSFLQNLRTWPVFGKGWGRRVAGVKQTALGMVGKYSLPPMPEAPKTTPAPHASRDVVEGSAKAPEERPEGIPASQSQTIWAKITQFILGGGTIGAGTIFGIDWRIAVAVIVVMAGLSAFIIWHRLKRPDIKRGPVLTWLLGPPEAVEP